MTKKLRPQIERYAVRGQNESEFLIYKTQIKSRQPAVSSVVEQAAELFERAEIEVEVAGEVCLILAEALNNVVEHAYRNSEDGDIDIIVKMAVNWVTIEINDFGPEYALPRSTIMDSPGEHALEDLPEGGFGWGLIEILTDGISLARIDNRNHLILSKKLFEVAT